MNKNSNLVVAILLFIGLVIYSCATPTTPTGGPPDEQGPNIIRTNPETGTTNFSGRSISLHFSEFVERSSLREAITVEPDIGLSYEIDWGRKSATIEFDQSIPDSTTLIVTIGTELTDTRNNGMSSPQKVAVSTGDEIDEGEISGTILDAKSGEGSEGNRILLYREPYDITQRADYTASTDTSGQFQFSYLPEGTFKLFWVDDRNRNKIWDTKQERAQPFSQEFITLKKGGSDTLSTLFATSVDTTHPVLQGVGLFSTQRMRMRFSENISLTDSAQITITDSLDNDYSKAFPLYIQPAEPYILFAQSEDSLRPESSYSLQTSGITDGSDNPIETYSGSFSGSAQEDTTQQRIIKRNTTTGYYPTEPFEITYAKPIIEAVISDSLKIIEGDTLIEDWSNIEIQQNIFRVHPREQWKDGVEYEIRVWDPRIEDYRKFDPQIWHKSQLGALNVIIEDSTLSDIHVRIKNEQSGFVQDTTFAEQVEINNLPALDYKITVYHDKNGNGRWDYGQIDPFEKPESYYIRKRVSVQKDLTGDLIIEFSK